MKKAETESWRARAARRGQRLRELISLTSQEQIAIVIVVAGLVALALFLHPASRG